MAMNQFDLPYRSVACTAATAKCVVGVKPAANIAVKVLEQAVSFDGATSSNAPAVVDIATIVATWSVNPPSTNSTALTPVKRDPARGETVQATAGHTWTTEPTTIVINRAIDVGQFNGLYHYIHPFASPLIAPALSGVLIRITSPNNVNASGHIAAEE
jgi:hypothetical protein